MIGEQSFSTSSEQEQRRSRGLLVMRVLYFLYFGAIGTYFPFLNVYYKDSGLSGVQIGLVNTLGPLVAIFSATLWGMLNDRLGQPRLVFRVTIPGVILSVLALSMARTFPLIVLCSCMVSLFLSATIPLMDNTMLRLLGDQRARYGMYRVTGSLGFILTAFASGYLFEITGLHALFYVYAAILALFVLASTGLPGDPVRMPGSMWGGLGQMIRQSAWLVFAISAFLMWIANNGAMNFLGITIQEMGGTDRLIGLVSMMSAVAEIPVMVGSDWLLRRFGSTQLLVVSFTLFTLRGVLLAVMPAPWWAAGISTLGGLSFSLFWVSAVNYANESAPGHLKSTAQGLLFSIMNLAGMASSLNAGWLYDNLGFRGLYWTTAAFAFSALIIFLIGRLRYGAKAGG